MTNYIGFISVLWLWRRLVMESQPRSTIITVLHHSSKATSTQTAISSPALRIMLICFKITLCQLFTRLTELCQLINPGTQNFPGYVFYARMRCKLCWWGVCVTSTQGETRARAHCTCGNPQSSRSPSPLQSLLQWSQEKCVRHWDLRTARCLVKAMSSGWYSSIFQIHIPS